MNLRNSIFSFGVLMALFSVASCTKFDNPTPEFEEYTQDIDTTIRRKVLVIAVDGLVGSQIKEYQPTNIAKLMENSKYSFEAKADNNTNGYASWATLLTGYPSSQHHVTKESFMPDIDNSVEHGDFDFTPSIIYRIENTKKGLKTASVVQNTNMNTMFLGDADYNNVETSDKDVEQKTIKLIETNKPDFSIVQFKGLDEAGKDGGYLVSNAKYKAALDQIDTYIGNIVNAVEKNDNYTKENWLIILVSPQGGTATGTNGGATPDEINTFSLYYNKSFKKLELKSGSMNYLFLNGYFPGTYTHNYGVEKRTFNTLGVRAQSPAGSSSNVFNANSTTTKSITYEFKYRLREDNVWKGLPFAGGYVYWYNYFMGKDASSNSNTTKGWHLYGQNLNFQLRFENGSKTEAVEFTRGTDGDWNHYSFVFEKVTDDKTKITVYLNGVNIKSQEIAMGVDQFANEEPLTLGFNTQRTDLGYAHYDLSDVRVWNRALTADEARDLACQKDISESNKLYPSLIAYYQNFSGNTWLNLLDNNVPDLTISGSPEMRSTKNYTTCDQPADVVYLQNIDLFPEVYYWLNLEVNEDWKMPGLEFLNNFLGEFWKD